MYRVGKFEKSLVKSLLYGISHCSSKDALIDDLLGGIAVLGDLFLYCLVTADLARHKVGLLEKNS